jgi:hypothetical protein
MVYNVDSREDASQNSIVPHRKEYTMYTKETTTLFTACTWYYKDGEISPYGMSQKAMPCAC